MINFENLVKPETASGRVSITSTQYIPINEILFAQTGNSVLGTKKSQIESGKIIKPCFLFCASYAYRLHIPSKNTAHLL